MAQAQLAGHLPAPRQVDPDEAARVQEREKRRIAEARRVLVVIKAISGIMLRYKKDDDPVIRYSMFVDKLSMSLEVSSAMVELLDFDDLKTESFDGSEVRKKAEELINNVREEMDLLMKWIRLPHYSPDHPLGQQMRAGAKEHFENIAALK